MNANYGLFPPLGASAARSREEARAGRARARRAGPLARAKPGSAAAAVGARSRDARAGVGACARRCRLDVGSNSVLLLTVEIDAAGARAPATTPRWRPRASAAVSSPAASLDPAARARTRDAVVALRRACARRAAATASWAFATGAARRARDGARLRDGADGVPPGARSRCCRATTRRRWRTRPCAHACGERRSRRSWPSTSAGATTELTLGRGDARRRGGEPAARRAGAHRGARATPLRRGGACARAATACSPARGARRGASVVASGGTATALAALDLGLDALRPGAGARAHARGGSRSPALARCRAPRVRLACSTRVARAILPAGALVLDDRRARGGRRDAARERPRRAPRATCAQRLRDEGVAADLRALWG